MKRQKIKNRIINSVLFLLFLVGLALIFNQPIKNFLLKLSKDDYQVSAISRDQIADGLAQEATFDFDQVKPVDLDAVIRAQLSGKVLPVIGGVAVPSIQVQLPIFKGLNNDALLFGAGTFDPNQKMGEGNYSLASHRIEDTTILFTRLDEVKLEETVYLTDLENIYTYTVTVSKRIEPTEVEVLDVIEGKTMVTLITCGEREGVTRWLVQGELSGITSVKKATKEMLAAFSMEQQTF